MGMAVEICSTVKRWPLAVKEIGRKEVGQRFAGEQAEEDGAEGGDDKDYVDGARVPLHAPPIQLSTAIPVCLEYPFPCSLTQ
jgi:hypothetical protein